MLNKIVLNTPPRAHKPQEKLSRNQKIIIGKEIINYIEKKFSYCLNIRELQDLMYSVKLAIKSIQEGMNEGGVASSEIFPATNYYNDRNPLENFNANQLFNHLTSPLGFKSQIENICEHSSADHQGKKKSSSFLGLFHKTQYTKSALILKEEIDDLFKLGSKTITKLEIFFHDSVNMNPRDMYGTLVNMLSKEKKFLIIGGVGNNDQVKGKHSSYVKYKLEKNKNIKLLNIDLESDPDILIDLTEINNIKEQIKEVFDVIVFEFIPFCVYKDKLLINVKIISNNGILVVCGKSIEITVRLNKWWEIIERIENYNEIKLLELANKSDIPLHSIKTLISTEFYTEHVGRENNFDLDFNKDLDKLIDILNISLHTIPVKRLYTNNDRFHVYLFTD